MAYTLFECTGRIASDPKMINDKMCFYLESTKPSIDKKTGELVHQVMLSFVRYAGRNAEVLADTYKVNDRVWVNGEIIGNEADKGYPFMAKDKNGELFTRFDILSYSLRWLGKLQLNEKGQIVGGVPEDGITLIISGYVGNKDGIELRYLSDGTAYTNVSLATNRYEKDATGQRKELPATWWRCSVFGSWAERMMADPAKNRIGLGKGSSITVIGVPDFDPETGGPKIFDRRDGSKGCSHEMQVYRWFYNERAGNGGGGGVPNQMGNPDEIPDEDI